MNRWGVLLLSPGLSFFLFPCKCSGILTLKKQRRRTRGRQGCMLRTKLSFFPLVRKESLLSKFYLSSVFCLWTYILQKTLHFSFFFHISLFFCVGHIFASVAKAEVFCVGASFDRLCYFFPPPFFCINVTSSTPTLRHKNSYFWFSRVQLLREALSKSGNSYFAAALKCFECMSVYVKEENLEVVFYK